MPGEENITTVVEEFELKDGASGQRTYSRYRPFLISIEQNVYQVRRSESSIPARIEQSRRTRPWTIAARFYVYHREKDAQTFAIAGHF